MIITKIGHCCLLIEENGSRILTDPGVFSDGQNSLKDIDVVLITHEHPDHFHIPSLKEVIANNPGVQIVTNSTVAPLLDAESIEYGVMSDGDSKEWAGVLVEAYEELHAEIYKTMPRTQNTGFMIGETLFYPGDAFIQPHKPVPVLALPVAGPWMKVSECVDYALAVKPTVAFPVHDAIMKDPGLMMRAPQAVLPANGIEFVPMLAGDTHEF